MIKLIKPVFYFSVFCATQLSAMLDPQSLQLLPQDTFGVVTYHCTLQSLGRLKTTNKHFNKNVDIENIIKGALDHCFLLGEKYLYHLAPKFMQMQDGDGKQKLQQLLLDINVSHAKKIDSVILSQYEAAKAFFHHCHTENFDNFIEPDKLVLDPQKRLLFYCGKLPGRLITKAHDTIKENSFPEEDPEYDIELIATYDVVIAAGEVLRNVSRLKVIFQCYQQFSAGSGGFLHLLCRSQEYSDLVINYISLPDRGFNYTDGADRNAYEHARHYGNQQLINALELEFSDDLAIWMSKQKIN